MADKDPNDIKTGPSNEEKDDIGDDLAESLGSQSSGLTSSSDSYSMPKRQRETSPSRSPMRSESPSAPYRMVPPSPPKYVSLSEVMKAAHGIGNMVLAHEIAVDGDVQLQRNEPPPDSIEKKVGDVMKQAFWDALQEKLREEPPDFSHAIVLLEEVKQELLGLLLPQHNSVKTRINEVLDAELIEQQAEHGALDFPRYSDFVIDIMSKLCAPARDENIAELKQIKEVVPLYKKVFEVLELMKLDMANFTLQQARPLIQQHAVEYERAKFEDFLKMQEENNLDGLQYTKEWLRESFEALHKLSESLSPSKESPSQTSAGPSSTTSPSASGAAAMPPKVRPGGVISHAYVQLLIWPDTRPLPETLLVDEKRLCILQEEIEKLAVVCGVLLVTYSTVGAPIAGVQSLKTTLKNHLLTILQDVPTREFDEAMPKVGEQVIVEVQKCLCEHGFPRMSEERVSLLKGQVTSVHKPDHPVYKLIRSRILSLVSQLLNLGAGGGGRIQLPPGVSTVSDELQKTCASFMRIVTHNRAVFSQRYVDIIKSLEEAREQGSNGS